MLFRSVVSFFYIQEIKERQKQMENDWQEEVKRFEGDNLKVINIYFNLLYALLHNIRSGILKYIRTYIIICLFTLIFLIQFFISMNSSLFIVIDFLMR